MEHDLTWEPIGVRPSSRLIQIKQPRAKAALTVQVH
jgi:hypothetical protein